MQADRPDRYRHWTRHIRRFHGDYRTQYLLACIWELIVGMTWDPTAKKKPRKGPPPPTWRKIAPWLLSDAELRRMAAPKAPVQYVDTDEIDYG